MADLPGGTGFGLVVHSVLESADANATDLAAELHQRSAEALGRRLGATYDASQLASALLPSLQTPLGPLADDLRLCDIASTDRLPELDFELPLAGGDDPVAAEVTVAGVAELLRQRLPHGDSFAAYPDLLDGPGMDQQRLRGYLVGSIDAVLRVGPASSPRFLVVDYKTNWLGAAPAGSGNLTTTDYRPTVLREAMLAAHYPLQLLLYLVALHRFLRWRQRGYHPDVHLAGGLYCFVRGMAGPQTPVTAGTPHGVFEWAPPPGLVDALSRLLAGESP
jgi:exodeoxyribonuclease V beta subunit